MVLFGLHGDDTLKPQSPSSYRSQQGPIVAMSQMETMLAGPFNVCFFVWSKPAGLSLTSFLASGGEKEAHSKQVLTLQ